MMKTRNLIGMIVLCLFALAACTSSKESKKTLTVLSWNVWHGGHSKTYSGKGCEGTIDILKKSEADVVLMIETYGAAPMVADSLGYSYNLISDNLSIYSRYPIIRKYAFADSISTFNFGGVMIDVNGKPVRVFDTWLHYLPDMRLARRINPRKKYWLGRWREHVMRKYIRFCLFFNPCWQRPTVFQL